MMKRIFGLFAPALVAGFLLAGGSAQAQNCSGSPNANTICAGPSSGGSGFPNFRAMVNADIPAGTVTGSSIASGTVANSNLANMAANSIKANTSSSPAAPVDFGTGTGTAQFIFNSYGINIPGFDIASGSSGTPITTQGPTFRFSRVENITPSVSVCNNNAVDNECNATVAMYSTATASDGMQNTAAYIAALSSSTNAAGLGPVGATLIGRVIGSGNGIGTGAYIEGRRDTNTGNAFATEMRVTNQTATAGTYNSSGASSTQGIWLTSGGTAVTGAGISLGGVSSQSFVVGYAATAGSVTGQTFRDDSNSATSIQINGTHATAQIAGTGFSVNGTGQTNLSSSGTQLSFLGTSSGSVNVFPNATSSLLTFTQPLASGAAGVNTGGLSLVGTTSGTTVLSGTSTGGHLSYAGSGTVPTLTAGCNGSGSSISGTDISGSVGNQTAAATTCTVTFGTAFSVTPRCIVSGRNTPVTSYTPSISTLIINFASTTNAVFDWACFGA